jgi:hypothetical protein
MCNLGDHDACMGEIKLCLCEVCWTSEEEDELDDAD